MLHKSGMCYATWPTVAAKIEYRDGRAHAGRGAEMAAGDPSGQPRRLKLGRATTPPQDMMHHGALGGSSANGGLGRLRRGIVCVSYGSRRIIQRCAAPATAKRRDRSAVALQRSTPALSCCRQCPRTSSEFGGEKGEKAGKTSPTLLAVCSPIFV